MARSLARGGKGGPPLLCVFRIDDLGVAAKANGKKGKQRANPQKRGERGDGRGQKGARQKRLTSAQTLRSTDHRKDDIVQGKNHSRLRALLRPPYPFLYFARAGSPCLTGRPPKRRPLCDIDFYPLWQSVDGASPWIVSRGAHLKAEKDRQTRDTHWLPRGSKKKNKKMQLLYLMAQTPVALVLVPLVLASIARLLLEAYAKYRARLHRPPASHTPYDLSVAIDSMAGLVSGGWIVRAPSLRIEPLSALKRRLVVRPDETVTASDPPASDQRDRTEPTRLSDDSDVVGPVMTKAVTFLGRRGVGKTFCANRLYGLGLADGPLHPTPGLSIVWPAAPHLPTIVDTAGDGAPTLAGDADAMHDRRLTDGLVRDLALQCADQAVMVVDAMTTSVQQDIDALARRMARRGRRHLFVLHNMRYADTMIEADRVWRDNVTDVYASVGHLEHTGDSRIGHFVTEIGGVRVYHMRVAREGSDAGSVLNAHALGVLRARLDALGVARLFDPCAAINRHLEDALPRLVVDPMGIEWHPEGVLAEDAFGGQDGVVCRIRPAADRGAMQMRLRAARVDTNTGVHLVDTAGDAESDFDAPVEVLNKDDHLVVRIDVPGVDVGSLTVTSVASPRGQYAEVRGLRAPVDDSGVPKADSAAVDRHASTGPAQGKRTPVSSRRILERPMRSGRMCVRVAMPPGSRIDPATVVCADGVLSIVIRRQVEPVLVPVSASPAPLVPTPAST